MLRNKAGSVAWVGVVVMRALFIGALAAALVGCTSPHPRTSVDRKPAVTKVGTKTVKSVRPKKIKAVAKATPARTTTGSIASRPTSADPVTDKAKAAIAAMLDNPASAEFSNVRRAQKDLLHRRVDTICGQVRARGGKGG